MKKNLSLDEMNEMNRMVAKAAYEELNKLLTPIQLEKVKGILEKYYEPDSPAWCYYVLQLWRSFRTFPTIPQFDEAIMTNNKRMVWTAVCALAEYAEFNDQVEDCLKKGMLQPLTLWAIENICEFVNLGANSQPQFKAWLKEMHEYIMEKESLFFCDPDTEEGQRWLTRGLLEGFKHASVRKKALRTLQMHCPEYSSLEAVMKLANDDLNATYQGKEQSENMPAWSAAQLIYMMADPDWQLLIPGSLLINGMEYSYTHNLSDMLKRMGQS